MRFRQPFTPQQRREAAAKYRSYRRNYKLLRTAYEPRSEKEFALLREYRRQIKQFGTEAAKTNREIDPDLLNDLESRCNALVAEYFAERMKGKGSK